MRFRFVAAAALLVLAAACGSRTTLRDPAQSTTGTGGAGGGGSTSSTATATGSGGSAFAVCAGLIESGPLIKLSTPDSSGRDPLLLAGLDGKVIALVRQESLESPGVGPSSLASFVVQQPWGAWPPALGGAPTPIAANLAPVPFAASVEPKGTLAVLAAKNSQGNPPGCDFAMLFGVASEGPPNPSALSQFIASTCKVAPFSVATADNGDHYLAGEHGSGSEVHFSTFGRLNADGTILNLATQHCASTAIVGDMIPGEADVLFVNAMADNDPCFFGSNNGVPGPARRIVLRHHLFVSSPEEITSVYQGADDVVSVRLLPRKGGSWLLFRESGASADVQPPGMAMPLGPDGPTGDFFPVTEPSTDRMAATALGDGFVVAFVDSIDPSAPKILVRVYSATGTLSAQTSFDTTEGWLSGDRLTLLGSPDGTSFLVGWSGTNPFQGNAVYLRRFDCVSAG